MPESGRKEGREAVTATVPTPMLKLFTNVRLDIFFITHVLKILILVAFLSNLLHLGDICSTTSSIFNFLYRNYIFILSQTNYEVIHYLIYNFDFIIIL